MHIAKTDSRTIDDLVEFIVNLSILIQSLLLLQKCSFGVQMLTSPLKFQAHTCDKMSMLLQDCNDLVPDLHFRNRHHKEYKVLLLRSGMDPSNFEPDLDICEAHRRLLGKNFNQFLHLDRCMYPSHKVRSTQHATKRVSFDESKASLKVPALQLPYGMPLCVLCHKFVTKLLPKLPPPEQSSSEEMDDLSKSLDRSVQMDGDGGEDLSEESSESSPGSSAEIFQKQEEAAAAKRKAAARAAVILEEKIKLEALNAFMNACKQETFPSRQRYRKAGFDTDRSRQLKVLKGVSRGVTAILQTVTQVPSDRINIWEALKKSGLIEQLLGVEVTPSDDLAEIIRHYNAAPTYAGRIQTLATIVKNYTFAELNKYNEKKSKQEIEPDEDDLEVDITLDSDVPTWNPPLTRYIFNQSDDHSDNTKHFLESVIREPRNYWQYDLEVIMGIINFTMSPAITQQVAFNTRLVNDPCTGEKTRIARVMRRYCDAELARMIQDHLIEQNYPLPHPGLKTICRILKRLPATKDKSLEGLNPSHEKNSRAFATLAKILNQLKKIQELYIVITAEDVDILEKAIETGKVYIKNIYRHSIYILGQ